MNRQNISESDTEKRILAAATRVFLAKGRTGARMQEIASEAGINKALLHYYFRSKERLYRMVFTREVEAFFRGLAEAIPPTEEIETFLASFVENYLDRLAGNPQVIRFITWEIGTGGPVAREVIANVIRGKGGPSLFTRYFIAIERAIEVGRIRPLDPRHLLFSLLGMCLYVFLTEPILSGIFPDIDIHDPSFMENRKKEICRLVWNGIRAERGGLDG
jgi:TetR/AcrR family transcriptional regulator